MKRNKRAMALKMSGLASKGTNDLGFGLYVFNHHDTLTFFLFGDRSDGY